MVMFRGDVKWKGLHDVDGALFRLADTCGGLVLLLALLD